MIIGGRDWCSADDPRLDTNYKKDVIDYSH